MAEALTFEAVASSMRTLAIAGLEPCTERLAQLPHRRLVDSITLNEGKINWELSDSRLRNGASQRQFMPLPVPRGGYYLAFFRPTFYPEAHPAECKVEIVMVTDTQDRELVGLRFERGLEENDTHAYAHVQLTRVFGCGLETDWPAFTPQSYPAFPTRCPSMGDVWLAVLVSLYGLSTSSAFGLEQVIAGVEEQQRTVLVPSLLPRSRALFMEAA